MEKRFGSLREFYPFYLTEHSNQISRVLHFTGTSLFILLVIYCIVYQKWLLLLLGPVVGYSFAWIGHFFFEKNKPATFQYPLYSLASDFIMLFHFLTGQLARKRKEAQGIR